jgi:hypothetical protein
MLASVPSSLGQALLVLLLRNVVLIMPMLGVQIYDHSQTLI